MMPESKFTSLPTPPNALIGREYETRVICELARWEENFPEARRWHQYNLDHHRALGDLRGIAIAHLNLGLTAVAQQDYAHGTGWLLACANEFRELGERQNTPYVLQGLAEISAAQSEYERAALLLGAMEALCEILNFRLWGDDARMHADQVARLQTHLEHAQFQEFWKQGRALSFDEAIARVLS